MATRTEFPGLNRGDGLKGLGSPGVLAAKLLGAQVLAERNRTRGLTRKMLTDLDGRWDEAWTKDLVVIKQYAVLRDINGAINPNVIGKPAWTHLWTYARGPLGGRCNDLVVEEIRRREEARKALAAKTTAQNVRARIVNSATRMVSRAGLYRYAQIRLFPYLRSDAIHLEQFFRRWDCSSSCLGWMHDGGAPNPQRSDGKYDGSGHTGTLWAAGVRVTTPRPGDLAFYGDDWLLGYWRPQHVALVINQTQVATFGSNPPKIASIHYRRDFRGFVDVLG